MLTVLDNLYDTLRADSALMAMVGSNIYKNRKIKDNPTTDEIGNVNDYMISCEVQDIAGHVNSDEPILIVDIRTRKGTSGDGGAEYCAEIADAVRALLATGFTGTEVKKIQGQVNYDKEIMGYRCRLEIFCHIKGSFSLSLSPSLASPQAIGTEIIFTAIASPNFGLEYRFSIAGPGTGNVKRYLTGWTKDNSISFIPKAADIGTSTIAVEISSEGSNVIDSSTSLSYIISSNLPAIVSFAPNLASPQPPGLEIELIVTATSSNENELVYKFWHQPPGASYWKDVSYWITHNWYRWTPRLSEVGVNTFKVHIRDGKHADKGGYDATSTITYTIAP